MILGIQVPKLPGLAWTVGAGRGGESDGQSTVFTTVKKVQNTYQNLTERIPSECNYLEVKCEMIPRNGSRSGRSVMYQPIEGGGVYLPEQALHGFNSLRLESDGHACAVAGGHCGPHKVSGEVPLHACALQVLPPKLELQQMS